MRKLKRKEKIWFDYVAVLTAELDSLYGLADSHRFWESPRIEIGELLRTKLGITPEDVDERIAELEERNWKYGV